MAIVVTTQGAEILLSGGFNQAFTLRLFTNDITPEKEDVEGDYTEASGHGYAAIALPFSDCTVTEGNLASAVYAAKTFSFTSALGAIVYGYFVTRDSDGKQVWADRLDTPFATGNNGGTLEITQTINVTELI